ncbi:pentapeptide repeat-containing protein [Nostoc sp. UHCC 0702]|nr:pentapeptide repeat-containing protein [Nostoc sp. UHCC 0702]
MHKRLSEISNLLITPLKTVLSTEKVEKVAELGNAFAELAKTLQEQGKNISFLKPLIEQSGSLLGVLCSPEVQVISAGLPFVPFAIALLKYYREKHQTEPTLEVCVAIIAQAAYLESCQEILSLYSFINWNNNADITQALNKLNDVELDYQAASNVIACFHKSELAKAFNTVLSARLEAAKIPSAVIDILTQRIAWNTHRYILKAWIESGNAFPQVIQPSFGEWQQEQQKFNSIDDYLTNHIAKKPLDQVFDESFSFKDIYVPLKARKVDKNGKLDTQSTPFILENWAKKILLDNNPDTQRQVIFIQGGPGRGKSVFCRMFADWVRQYLHPWWTPILIRLRDIQEFQPSLAETLRSRVKADFAESDDGWLTDVNTRFLFILDGFDELRIERSNNQSIERFLRQVGSFQNDAQESAAMQHRVLITGRQMALHGIDRLPENLERVEIAEMDAELQNQWFAKWYQQFSTNKTTGFKEFLQKNKSCPEQVKELAKEPLLLYMLTAMHRDDKLDISKLEQATGTDAKILVYEQALDWVLTKQRSDPRHRNLNEELTRQNSDTLRRILAEAAVCVVQSGGESASMQMIKARLDQDDAAKEFIAEAEKELGETALKTALAAFYLKSNDSGGVEFFHKSFCEFLCAERIKQSLEEWTEPGKRGKAFNVDDDKLHWEIYDLFGYGGLTWEILEYLMSLLVKSNEFRPVELFKRLENFYVCWCDGEFIDAPPENFPQKKMRLLQEKGIKRGQRQVDIYAGLNVMILLLELHRYGQEQSDEIKKQMTFYPSGQPEGNWRTVQLLPIIHYSDCIQLETFNNVVGQFLSGAKLSRAYLTGADLRYADLSGADLSYADLSGAYLSEADFNGANLSGAYLNVADLSSADLSSANLSSAKLSYADLRSANLNEVDLSGADLSGANLSGADLSGADLSGADLTGVDLSGAYLSGTNFNRANFSRANLSDANASDANLNSTDLSDGFFGDIQWDEYTNWENVQGLDTATNVPEALKQQLGLS